MTKYDIRFYPISIVCFIAHRRQYSLLINERKQMLFAERNTFIPVDVFFGGCDGYKSSNKLYKLSNVVGSFTFIDIFLCLSHYFILKTFFFSS